MHWFTSDTHFGSENTLKFSRRPFTTTYEMDLHLVENWNSVVQPSDTVWHLGDFGEFSVIKKYNLKGQINILLGNHEYYIKDQDKLKRTLEDYGVTIIPSGTKFTLSNDLRCHLSHEPSKMIPTETKDVLNLFGHVHKLSMVKRTMDTTPTGRLVKRRGLNVGTDCHDFTPINTDTVKFYRDAIWDYYDDEVFL